MQVATVQLLDWLTHSHYVNQFSTFSTGELCTQITGRLPLYMGWLDRRSNLSILFHLSTLAWNKVIEAQCLCSVKIYDLWSVVLAIAMTPAINKLLVYLRHVWPSTGLYRSPPLSYYPILFSIIKSIHTRPMSVDENTGAFYIRHFSSQILTRNRYTRVSLRWLKLMVWCSKYFTRELDLAALWCFRLKAEIVFIITKASQVRVGLAHEGFHNFGCTIIKINIFL